MAFSTALIVAGCSQSPRPGSVSPEQAATASAINPDSSRVDSAVMALTRPLSPQDSARALVVRDSVAQVTAADSAADVAMLERLAAAHPDSGAEVGDESHGGANEAGATSVTWDIDVETYNSHARVQYYLDFFQTTARERMGVWLTRMPLYEPMIRAKLKENGVPEDMVYLALIESGYSNSAVSRSRATGMWQFMKGTAKLYGLRVDPWVDERRDPIRATDAAAHYLSDLRDQFGSIYLAAAAYNAGAGKVGRGLKRLPEDDEEDDAPDADFFRLYDTRFLRRETKDYVPKLIAAALIAKQPEKYGFPRAEGIAPLAFDSIVVPEATGLDVIARLADTTTAAIRELNPKYLRGVTPPHTPSVVRLPAGTGQNVFAEYAALPAKNRITTVEHIVSRGQTLSGIAHIYGVSTKTVIAANPSLKGRTLRSGTHVIVPVSGANLTVREPVSAGTASTNRASNGNYRVGSGESLWTIGQKFGVSVEQLRTWNGLSAVEGLKAGQWISVTAPDSSAQPSDSAPASVAASGDRTHTVRPGETLSGIAKQYGTTVSALRQANRLSPSSVLKSGTRLTIPS
jgi:peptidoglycan lytic transglycosylase D